MTSKAAATRWTLALACALSLAAGPARAQALDLVSLSGQYMPGVPLVDVPGNVQVSSYEVSGNVPIPIDQKTFLISGLGYHVDSVSFAGTRPDFIDLKAFHSLEGALLFVQLLPKGWSLAARLAAGLAGDFQQVDAGMFRLSSFGMISRSVSPRLTLGLGAVNSFAFGTFLPLPAAMVDWRILGAKPSEHAPEPFHVLRLDLFAPVSLALHSTLGNRVRFGGALEFSGNQYAVRDARLREAWPCAARANDDPSTAADETRAQSSRCFDNLAYAVGVAGATLGARVVSSVWLNLLAGHSFYRRFDPRNAAGDELPGGGQQVPNGWLVRASLVWRLPGRD